ncbi:MAG TPA: E3 binding domain-containing protein [Actinospica sp.]|nr:E3 binding domain-containing protein [Actinospica sp.]
MTETAAIGRSPRHRHSPRVRRLAAEAGLDPDHIEGTGPNGRVRPGDIAAFAQPTTYVVQLGLSGDRPDVVAAIAYELLEAVRRHVPIVDVEIISGDQRVLIHDGRNETDAAITVVDGRMSSGDVIRVAPLAANRLLNAMVGPTDHARGTTLLVVSTSSSQLPVLTVVNGPRSF